MDFAPQLGIDAPDDDLIDYETDAEGELNDKEHNKLVQEILAVGKPDFEFDSADEDAESRDDNVDDLETNMEDKDAPIRSVPQVSHTHASESRESAHEIDYDIEENVHVPVADDAAETGLAEAVEQQLSEGLLKVENEAGEEEQSPRTEDHEITWEQEHSDAELDEHANEASAMAKDENASNVSPSEVALTSSEAANQDQAQAAYSSDDNISGTPSYDDDDGDDDDDDGDGDGDGDGHGEEAVPAEISASSPEQEGKLGSESKNVEFPSIVVHYKGEEFPFFSSTSEGFFSHLSVLDDNVRVLLAGLRAELSSEILEDDDLVFQVDELGLEFAESSSPDILTDFTLGQILEVFDILVNNQDYDDSRALYTSVFTRPNPARRFELLMEKASVGTGLDKVIELFQPPDSSHVEELAAAWDGDALNALTDEDDDDNDEQITHDVEHAAVTTTTFSTEQVVDVNETVKGSEWQEKPGNMTSQVQVENGSHGGDAEADEDSTEAVSTKGLVAQSDVEDAEEQIQEQRLVKDAYQQSSHVDMNDQQGFEANDLIGFEFDEPIDAVSYRSPANDGEDVKDDMEHLVADIGAHDASTSTTPTTTNLQRDGDVSSSSTQSGAIGAAAGNADLGDAALEDDVGEIDWRDEPESHSDHVGDASLSAAKRARADDEVRAEDTQNVKRRRP